MRANGTAILCMILAILSVIGTARNNSAKGALGKPARQITCKGKVVDATGGPVAGAKVGFYKLTVNFEALTYDMALAQELTTKADGAFTLETEAREDDVSGQTIILAQKEGLALGWANWRLNEDLDVEIILERSQVMAGKVVDDTGKPVSDAKVSIAFMVVMGEGEPQYLVSADTLEPLTTRTDAEGRFSFGRIPTDATAEFLVKKPTKATVSTFNPENYQGQALQFSSGQTDVVVALPPEARIEGIVVEKATGKPAAGIRIMATKGRNQPNFGLKPIVSGEDGKFIVNALGGGAHTLRVVTSSEKETEWIAESVEVVTETGKTRSGIRLELSEGGLLEVAITEAVTGKPVPEARVSVRQQAGNKNFSGISDSNGIARVRLVPGEYQLGGVYKPDYTSPGQQETVTVEDGKTTRLELQLKGQPKISGVVRDDQGNPVPGAKLRVCPMGGRQDIISDAEGKFEISWRPWRGSNISAVMLVARHEEGNLAGAVEIDEDTRTKDITLRPGLTITGRVIDPDGKGIADARVLVMLRVETSGSPISNDPAKIDAQGKFQVRAVPADQKYSIQASAEGFGVDRIENVHADEAVDSLLALRALRLPVANLSISGTVVDTQDKPVAGAQVWGYGDTQPQCRAQTDSDGKFTFENVCAGKIRISANKSGAARLYGNVETEGGASDVKVIISESSSSTRYVPKRPTSLVGKPLPDLKDVKLDLPPADLTGKMLLVCFFDMEQRPSRNYLRQVNTMAKKLATRNVVVVAVQASKMDQDNLNNWCKKYRISIPVGMVEGDEEKAKSTWGVRSLPWLILTDRQHIVRANGFSLTELNAKIEAAK